LSPNNANYAPSYQDLGLDLKVDNKAKVKAISPKAKALNLKAKAKD